MTMTWRSGIPFSQAKTADKAISFFVVGKLQAHSFRIIFAARKTIILLQTHVACLVTGPSGFLLHRLTFFSWSAKRVIRLARSPELSWKESVLLPDHLDRAL